MKKYLMFLLKAIISLAFLLLLYVVFVLIHGTISDYQPDAVIELEAKQNSDIRLIGDSILSFTIWNLGYGGLGEESDFFYDGGNQFFSGGKMIRPSRSIVEKNVKGAVDFAGQVRSDFFLFQEVDYSSKRSYFINQFEGVKEQLPDFAAYFAPNYKVERVPIPLLEPWRVYGQTLSGLATYSRFQAHQSTRYQLPGNFSWPTCLFMLDRCVSVHRYPHQNGKDLVVFNIHNSAYDANGDLKKLQMEFLRRALLEEYQLGNYVIAGGDWNKCPPYFQFDTFMPGNTQGYTQLNVDPEFFPSGWKWIYDPAIPTNRKTRSPFKAGETFITIIDFFLVSPNVKVLTVKTVDQQFKYSDHQPVWMEVELL